jgi:tetratricopeptide (TPR) repeat protein
VRSLTGWEDAFASLGRLGGLACHVGDYEQAEQLLQERLALARDRANPDVSRLFIAWALNHLGDAARCQDDMGRAAPLYEESLTIFRQHEDRQHGDRQGIAAVLHNLAHVELSQGNTGRARALFLESLNLFQGLNFDWSMADCLVGLAGVASQEGRPERAALLFGAAEAAQEVIDLSGILTEPANARARNRDMAAARGAIDAEAWEKAWSAGRAMSLEQAVASALGEGA